MASSQIRAPSATARSMRQGSSSFARPMVAAPASQDREAMWARMSEKKDWEDEEVVRRRGQSVEKFVKWRAKQRAKGIDVRR
jgi:hypothetical protein